MRVPRLARIAAEAESLRLRLWFGRVAVRVVLYVIAFVFMLDALIFAHIAAWFWLRLHWEQLPTALILCGADIVLAGFLGLVAARSTPGRVEIEALAVRQQAITSMTGTVAVSSLVIPLVRLAMGMFRRRGS